MKILSFHLKESKILALIIAEIIWDLYIRTCTNLGFVQCTFVHCFKLKLKTQKAIKVESTFLYNVKMTIFDCANNWALKSPSELLLNKIMAQVYFLRKHLESNYKIWSSLLPC